MSLFKCKMCGGSLDVPAGSSVIECEYCGTQQTLPKLDDDKRANMYDRANHFRRNNEFDKAMGIYENILNEDNTDAEAYWSLVLCRYGIEYVEDPSSHKRIPTVNRAQFTSIFDDDNYKSALQYADSYQSTLYEGEAKAINEIQKGILAISQKEEPFDVFICYKESDASGKRTQDSVLAQDLYYGLKNEGFKVFFARITLEDKLGSAYEPYIFAALNSAKVMVVLGTKPEYFNAVWVKNEWSRYLALIKQGQKKMLIPAYKDMDPYDLPEEFSHLQAQDMSKLGFMQDLIRGIKKIAKSDEPKPTTVVKETVVTSANTNVAPLLKRAFMFLEDSKWSEANEYCEKVLDQDPENAQAYLGKLMAELRVKRQEDFVDCDRFHPNIEKTNKTFSRVLQYGDETLVNTLKAYLTAKARKIEEDRKVLFIEENGVLKKYKGMGGFEIPSHIVNIEKDAFALCDKLTSITIPNSITSIGYRSFASCKSLKRIEIPDSVTSIGDSAFEGCNALQYIDLPNSVTSIGKSAFEGCSALRYIDLPNSITHIGNSAFTACEELQDIEIPNSVTHIGAEAFACCFNIESFEIPDSIKSIGDSVFQGCFNLQNIKIPNSVTSIGKSAFEGCSSLESIEIPKSIISIGANAFNDCENLTIYAPDTLDKSLFEGYNNVVYRKSVQESPAAQTPTSTAAQSNTGGCYVATCVYGSYDCPQVWTLRRYRDDTLGSTWYGRLLIRTYYAISPTLVRWFGKTNWFKKFWKGKLDRMVAKLQSNGVEDTPYEDKAW